MSPMLAVVFLGLGILIGVIATRLRYKQERARLTDRGARLLVQCCDLRQQLELVAPIVDAAAPPVADRPDR
jgi:hypothetical protein